ncbi:MAG: hypothetical protein FWC57_06895 [Endomicrobia bacterium]|nr:hypothetical protein [Endomicrobiia bacterium]
MPLLFVPDVFSENHKVIYSVSAYWGLPRVEGYVIKNNNLYICLAEEDKEKRTQRQVFSNKVIYKVENYKLQPAADLTAEEAKDYIEKNKNNVINNLWWEYFEPMNGTFVGLGKNLLKLKDNVYIERIPSGTKYDPVTFLNMDTNLRMSDYSFWAYLMTYVYIENNNIYFDGSSEKHKKQGIFTYNMNTGEVSEVACSYFNPREPFKDGNLWPSSVSYKNPVRIPNTPYLLFCIDKSVNNGVYDEYKNAKWHSFEHYDIKNYFEIAIIEIPEWKVKTMR